MAAPALGIGPQPSHLTEIRTGLEGEHPCVIAADGDVLAVYQALLRLKEQPVGTPRSVPDRILACYFQVELLPRLIAELEAIQAPLPLLSGLRWSGLFDQRLEHSAMLTRTSQSHSSTALALALQNETPAGLPEVFFKPGMWRAGREINRCGMTVDRDCGAQSNLMKT